MTSLFLRWWWPPPPCCYDGLPSKPPTAALWCHSGSLVHELEHSGSVAGAGAADLLDLWRGDPAVWGLSSFLWCSEVNFLLSLRRLATCMLIADGLSFHRTACEWLIRTFGWFKIVKMLTLVNLWDKPKFEVPEKVWVKIEIARNSGWLSCVL